jgi:hypothetical protein
MANPISSALKRVTRHPLLQSTTNRVVLFAALVFALIIVFGVIGGYRESRDIAACKAQGGKSIYRTKTQELPADAQGTIGISQKYQVFDRCEFSNK